jgi:(R,R)-butanediol dehydrogenase/meso-butanediol dehydrogenase/diacetyl reductase
MKAAVYEGSHEITVKDVPEPEVGSTEVLVEPKYVGICGTDLSAWEYGMYEPGLIMGHEFSGEIVEIGKDVTSWEVGDRIVPNSLLPCGKCSFCKAQKFSICDDMQMVGITMNGGLAELVALPQEMLHRLPNAIDDKKGAFVEPLSIALHGFNRIDFKRGNSVLVLGTGPIGILSLHFAKLLGASVVYASEIRSARLEMARKAGADFIINPAKESLPLRIESLTEGVGVDVVVECTGVPGPSSEAFQLVKRGGTILILGISEEPVEVDFMRGVLNELSLKFSYLGYREFPEAIRLLAEDLIDPIPMVTRVISLDRVVEDGFEALTRSDNQDVKVLVKI